MKKNYAKPTLTIDEFFLNSSLLTGSDGVKEDGNQTGVGVGGETDDDVKSNKKGFGSNSIWD